MKKFLSILTVLCLLFSVCFADDTPDLVLTENDFVLVLSDVPWLLGESADGLRACAEEALKVQMEYAELESVTGVGFDREYACDKLVFGTCPGENGDLLESVLVMTDEIQTARGACVGMTLAGVADLYGEEFDLELDQMIFTLDSGTMQLIFTIDIETDEVLCWSLILL